MEGTSDDSAEAGVTGAIAEGVVIAESVEEGVVAGVSAAAAIEVIEDKGAICRLQSTLRRKVNGMTMGVTSVRDSTADNVVRAATPSLREEIREKATNRFCCRANRSPNTKSVRPGPLRLPEQLPRLPNRECMPSTVPPVEL